MDFKRRTRRSSALNLGLLNLERNGAKSVRQQLYEVIRDGILTGRLVPGGILPSTRVLAEETGISRSTAIAVFELLILEGLLVATKGSGTRVTDVIPSEFLALALARSQSIEHTTTGLRLMSRRATEMATFVEHRAGGLPRPFAPGLPAIDQFPIAAWSTLVAKRWRAATVLDLCSPHNLAAPELREAIAAYVGAARGAMCDSSSIIVASGAQQALDVTARVLSDPGDVCWIEEPGYRGARYALTLAGLKLVPAKVDEHGLDVDHAISTLPVPRLIYVTPSHQYPLGGMLTLERRIKLLQYADRVGAWVIEDDYDSEYSYSGFSVPCLQGLDAAARVIYIGSFNKALFPGLRIGFLIAPADLAESFRGARTFADGHPPAVLQSTLADFIRSGGFSSHLRRMRGIYVERRDALINALAQHIPQLTIGPNDRGLHFVATLPSHISDRLVSVHARASGFVLPPLSEFYMGTAEQSGLLFGFACIPPHEMNSAVLRLKDSAHFD